MDSMPLLFLLLQPYKKNYRIYKNKEKRMLELLILYILNKYDCTIYKIQKLIGEMFFIFSCPSLGAINPALKRLENLGCVEYSSFMSDGGKLSKTYKITPFGLKYLKETISLFDFKNSAHMLNNAKVCISISDVLDNKQKEDFYFLVANKLKILKKDVENKLKDPYILYTEIQRKVLDNTIKEIQALILTVEN